MSLVLVDLDGTLLPGASSERRFIARLLAHRRLGPAQLASALSFLLRHWPAYGVAAFKKNKAYLAGLPVAEVAALAGAFVHQDIEPRLRGALVRRIERHRRMGDVVALLSGAPDFIVAPLAAHLDVALWRATRCAQRDGRFLAEPPFRHPFAEDKLRYASEICAAVGVGLDECTAYADSADDLPLLHRVGRPVAVAPDRGLARVARREDWEVLDGPLRQAMPALSTGRLRMPR
jgi:HAD superfamily phosphoserine phosphatase-like hydrolase